ncbi:hypothetical protein SLA2020_410160 [Shorea laevis]
MKLLFTQDDEDKRECSRSEAEDEEDEEVDVEALSLCDLPVNFIVDHEKQCSTENKDIIKTEEDFDFGSWGGTPSAEMCAADEVFFKGQILPLRLSFSSDSGFTGLQYDSRNPSQSISRSDSMDHGSVSRLTNLSSRSSSPGSHISSSSRTSITNITRNSNSNPSRISNKFHPHPTPEPQITVSKSQPRNVSSRTQRLPVWDFFRAGLVRPPEIELQDLKLRNSQTKPTRTPVSRNSSCSSSNSSSDVKIKNPNQPRGFFSGCKQCSVGAVTTVPNNIVIKKSSKNEEEEKPFLEVKVKKKTKESERHKGKQALSRRRTYEWLKELSHSHDADA